MRRKKIELKKKNLCKFNTIFFICFFLWNESKAQESIYIQKCSQCHMEKTTELTKDEALKAPPMDALARQLRYNFRTKEKLKEFLFNYLNQPSQEKSICKPCIKRWGLMPSIQISEEEAKSIAEFIYRRYYLP